MARPASLHPTDVELEILHVLWADGPSALSTVCDRLREQREVATTTVATMLRVMLDKGLVKRRGADKHTTTPSSRSGCVCASCAEGGYGRKTEEGGCVVGTTTTGCVRLQDRDRTPPSSRSGCVCASCAGGYKARRQRKGSVMWTTVYGYCRTVPAPHPSTTTRTPPVVRTPSW